MDLGSSPVGFSSSDRARASTLPWTRCALRPSTPIADAPQRARVADPGSYHSATEPSSWKTRAMGRVPPNGYLASACSVRSNPNPGLSDNGNRPSTIRMAGNPSHSSQTLSVGTRLDLSADLLHDEVRDRGVHMQSRQAADRALAGVRRHRDAGHRGHLRHLPKPRDPAHVIDVGLQNVDHSHLDELDGIRSRPPVARRWRSGSWSGARSWPLPRHFPAGTALR